MSELKTLKDIDWIQKDMNDVVIAKDTHKIREEAIKLIKNLQYKDSIYPLILEKFPETLKGELAKDKWNDNVFKYGTEYGMIAVLLHFFNITEEELK